MNRSTEPNRTKPLNQTNLEPWFGSVQGANRTEPIQFGSVRVMIIPTLSR